MVEKKMRFESESVLRNLKYKTFPSTIERIERIIAEIEEPLKSNIKPPSITLKLVKIYLPRMTAGMVNSTKTINKILVDFFIVIFSAKFKNVYINF